MTVEELNTALLVGASVLLLGIIAVRVSTRSGLPSLLLYLLLGLLLGEDVLGIEFDDFALARTLAYAALIVILAEGGLTTNWAYIRGAMGPASMLATIGILVSVAITAMPAWLLLDVGWRSAILIGAVVASTDAAAVFSVLRRLGLPRRPASALEAESGMNDAPAILLVVALSTTSAWDAGEVIQVAGMITYQLGAGAVVGLVIGRLATLALRRVALPASGLYPLAVLTFAVLAYATAGAIEASGFLAVYVASLVLGNSHLPHGPATRGFAEGFAWLAQIGLFIMLGLLATPSQLGPAILPAIGIGLSLLLVARPVSVWLSTVWFRMPWREQALLSWAGLRGAVPIVLATVPVVEGVAEAARFFNIVFVLVIVFTLVQGPTLPWAVRRLGLASEYVEHEIDLESAPLGQMDADVLTVRVPQGSPMNGIEVFELRLPRGALVTLIVRDGEGFVPGPNTVIRSGDEFLVVTTASARRTAERRLRAVSRRGKLAGWFGESGE